MTVYINTTGKNSFTDQIGKGMVKEAQFVGVQIGFYFGDLFAKIY